MNRPRNQPSGTSESSRGRGRGRGRGHGFRRDHDSPSQPYGPVPSSAQVIPGAGVSIVLKVDQPTGQQVQGIVSEVLGRGEHPRGIKVRLVDGRVGRVQAMVSEDVAKAASAGLTELGRDGEIGMSSSGIRTVSQAPIPRSYVHTQDMRNDGYDYRDAQDAREAPSLFDFVKTKPKKSKKSGVKPGNLDEAREEITATNGSEPDKAAVTKCPICNDFEGDPGAVEFHVNTHFD